MTSSAKEPGPSKEPEPAEEAAADRADSAHKEVPANQNTTDQNTRDQNTRDQNTRDQNTRDQNTTGQKPTAKKHGLLTRLWHWSNLILLTVLFMSGLNISNAHRYLYWGEWGFEPAQAWLAVPRFPGWMTIPGHYSLAMAREWHIAMAWPFAFATIIIIAALLVSKRLWRQFGFTRAEWRPSAIWQEVKNHLSIKYYRQHLAMEEAGNPADHGRAKYNFFQKLSYLAVLLLLLPGMVATGLAISPGFEPAAPWLVEFLGGRQSARSIHFIFSWALAGFFLIHIVMVLLSGPIRQIKDMITGGKA